MADEVKRHQNVRRATCIERSDKSVNLAETLDCQITNGFPQRQAEIRADTIREYRQPATSFSWYSLRNDVLNCLLSFDGVILSHREARFENYWAFNKYHNTGPAF